MAEEQTISLDNRSYETKILDKLQDITTILQEILLELRHGE